MAETDRLKEIEARLAHVPDWTLESVDIRWLIARVRELEAWKRGALTEAENIGAHLAIAASLDIQKRTELEAHVRELEADRRRLDWLLESDRDFPCTDRKELDQRMAENGAAPGWVTSNG